MPLPNTEIHQPTHRSNLHTHTQPKHNQTQQTKKFNPTNNHIQPIEVIPPHHKNIHTFFIFNMDGWKNHEKPFFLISQTN